MDMPGNGCPQQDQRRRHREQGLDIAHASNDLTHSDLVDHDLTVLLRQDPRSFPPLWYLSAIFSCRIIIPSRDFGLAARPQRHILTSFLRASWVSFTAAADLSKRACSSGSACTQQHAPFPADSVRRDTKEDVLEAVLACMYAEQGMTRFRSLRMASVIWATAAEVHSMQNPSSAD